MMIFPFSLEVKASGKITSIKLSPKPSACASPTEQKIIEFWLKKSTNPETHVDLEALPPFQKKVLQHLRTLSHNETTTYSELAEAIGHKGAARAVGTALANNPYPLVFPCHKVLKSDGSLGNFSCNAHSQKAALKLKKQLIEFERTHYEHTT
jgi:methylated-DNA-[protein]-cysteine S-methyltransferase